MFISYKRSGYTREGEQFASGLFLLLVQPKTQSTKYPYPNQIRAIVRHVHLSQFGHFMMGFARVRGERITVSGAYGSDGLPASVSDSVYDNAVSLPAELYDAWSKGGGWNGTGNERDAMQKWAIENLEALRS